MKRNVLRKRFFRELKREFGKYAVIFLFLTGAIGFVSGFLVASDSMLTAYNGILYRGGFCSDEKGKRRSENGCFEIGGIRNDLKKIR